jgi:hypothetical protein
MPFDFSVGAGERCTLYSRSEYRSSFPAGAAGEAAGRNMVSSISPSAAARDSAQLAGLYGFMKDCTRYSGSSTAGDLVRALKRAVDGGDVLAVVEQRRSSGAGSSGGNEPRPRSNHVHAIPSYSGARLA